MSNEFYDKLLNAIVADDVISYAKCENEVSCGGFLFGRFPVLSAMYLLRAKKLVRIYEEKYIKINSFSAVDETKGEPVVLSDAFRLIAGKCLRLYLDEVVTPCEILLLSGDEKRLQRLYPLSRSSTAVKRRLEEIYSIKYALSLKCERDEIVMDKRPRTRKEKKKIAVAVIGVVLTIAIIVSTPFVVNVFYPFINVPDKPSSPDTPDNPVSPDNPDNPSAPENGKYYLVNDVKDINFTSNNVYTLSSDIKMSAETLSDMTCTINGDGKKIIVTGAKPMFETFSGTLENTVIEVNLNGEITSDYAVIAKNNYGTIKNVTVNIDGKITVNGTKKSEKSDGVRLAGIAINNGSQKNKGVIESCTVSANLILKGTVASDASFSGITARNNYIVQKCTLNGSIESETVDVAGICDSNFLLLRECVNNAKIKQTSAEQTWSPFVAGINAHNYYVVENCINNGALTSLSTCTVTDDAYPTASVGGIAITNATGTYANGQAIVLYECKNNGKLTAETEHANICIGGIVARCYGKIQRAANYGDINAKSNHASQDSAVGGIAGISCGNVIGGYSKSKISLDGTFKSGGISGFAKNEIINSTVYSGIIQQCISESEIVLSPSSKASFIGGIVGYVDETLTYQGTLLEGYTANMVTQSYFLGTLTSTSADKVYLGSVIGGCDEHIAYEHSSDDKRQYFEDNYVIDNPLKGIGAIKNGDAYSDGNDTGTSKTTLSEIQRQDNYKTIMSALKSLLATPPEQE